MASVPKKANKFPLFVHKGRGYWCKTVLGKHHYFGSVANDPKGTEALKLWLFRKDWLLAGLPPPPYDPNGETTISVKYVCNRFIAAKEAKLEAGDLVLRSFEEHKDACKIILATIPADWFFPRGQHCSLHRVDYQTTAASAVLPSPTPSDPSQ